MSDPKPTDAAGPGYETSDARVGALVRWGGILALVTAASFGLMVFLVSVLTSAAERRELKPPPMMATGIQVPPEPRLQWRPNDELVKARTDEETALSGYAWVDKASGVLRIPVERAIDILAERGLPAREAEAR